MAASRGPFLKDPPLGAPPGPISQRTAESIPSPSVVAGGTLGPPSAYGEPVSPCKRAEGAKSPQSHVSMVTLKPAEHADTGLFQKPRLHDSCTQRRGPVTDIPRISGGGSISLQVTNSKSNSDGRGRHLEKYETASAVIERDVRELPERARATRRTGLAQSMTSQCFNGSCHLLSFTRKPRLSRFHLPSSEAELFF